MGNLLEFQERNTFAGTPEVSLPGYQDGVRVLFIIGWHR